MSVSLGIRCFEDRFSFVVFSGSSSSPKVVTMEELKFPASADRAEGLQWMRRQVQSMLDTHEPAHLGFKAAESMRAAPTKVRKNAEAYRSELEGVLQEAAISHKSQLIAVRWVNVQLKGALGVESKLKLEAAFTTPPLSGIKVPVKYREAALVALAQLA